MASSRLGPNKGRIGEIKDVLNALIERSEGEPLYPGEDPVRYAEVLPLEVPPTRFPASTLLFSYPNQTDAATGGLTANEWRFIQRSYFDYTNPEAALLEMETLVPALLTSIRRADLEDLLLPDGTDVQIEVEDAGDPDRAVVGETDTLIKSLYLIATTEEF